MILKTIVKIDKHERAALWLRISNWRRSITELSRYLAIAPIIRQAEVIPNADKVEEFIEDLLTKAYNMGKEA